MVDYKLDKGYRYLTRGCILMNKSSRLQYILAKGYRFLTKGSALATYLSSVVAGGRVATVYQNTLSMLGLDGCNYPAYIYSRHTGTLPNWFCPRQCGTGALFRPPLN